MRSDKRYTNQTIAKRVDYEPKRHRAPDISTEPLVCEICGNVYADRRWSKPGPEGRGKQYKHFRPAQKIVCPACRTERDGVPSGYVHMEGSFLDSHREEIENLLRNEAERAEEDNPLARIMRWEKDEHERLTIATTTEHLAQRLGHALEKAFSGEVRYDFSHDNKLAHVYWRRD
jgi:hypothetical protein